MCVCERLNHNYNKISDIKPVANKYADVPLWRPVIGAAESVCLREIVI